MKAHDPILIDLIDETESSSFSGNLWRTTFADRDPLVGGRGNARWSRAKKSESLYTSFERITSLSEVHHHLSQFPVFPSASIAITELVAIDLDLIDLTRPGILESMGLGPELSQKEYYSRAQEIGAAVRFLEHQAIKVPSMRVEGSNCVIFIEHIDIEESLRVNSFNKVDLSNFNPMKNLP